MQEEKLLELEFYHGFLPREDVVNLLHHHGDFLLRNTECFTSPIGQNVLVLSVMLDPRGQLNKSHADPFIKNSSIRTVVITPNRRNQIAITKSNEFSTIQQMLLFYTKNEIRIGESSVLLLNPVKLAKWEYPHKDILIERFIAGGAFGEVYKGKLKNKTGETVAVAVKLIKDSGDLSHKQQMHECMREARLMRGLSHPNVVKLQGVAACKLPIYILIEYAVGGSLDDYLKTNSGSIDSKEKLQMTLGAARAVDYLHGEGLIHRDIAARNFLLNENNKVKICDFGLAIKSTYTYSIISSTKLPLKWMAPESIRRKIFSQKSDVYSYGVLIYEIFSCKSPYEGQKNGDAAKSILDGNYNTFPASTPKELQNFVSGELWAKSPEARPTMHNVVLWWKKYTGFPNAESKEVVVASKADKPQ